MQAKNRYVVLYENKINIANERRYKMKKMIFIIFASFYFGISPSRAGNFIERESLIPCIVRLEQKRICQIEIDGIQSELWYKKPGEKKPQPKIERVGGTGFFISTEDDRLFLVAASHVAKVLTSSADVILAGEGKLPVRQPLSKVCGNSENITWQIHPEAEVAVLPLIPKLEFKEKYLEKHFLPARFIAKEKAPPPRDVSLIAFGFPLGLGTNEVFAPLTRQSYPASSFLKLARFDNKEKSTFFILEDPSIGGYSGAPVIDISISRIGGMTAKGKGTKIVGIIHGTLSDKTGGKLAAVTPSYFIIETIELAKKKLLEK